MTTAGREKTHDLYGTNPDTLRRWPIVADTTVTAKEARRLAEKGTEPYRRYIEIREVASPT